ncbi:MAG: ATP-binding protein [Myxococcota bacterium]
MTIRWKLFLIISCAVAAPVATLAAWLSASQLATLDEQITSKAVSLARILADEMQPAVAFDDAQTAREALASAATDTDVAYGALYRADRTTVAHLGWDGGGAPDLARVGVDHREGRVRVVAPVASPEGPRGTLVLDVSTAVVAEERAAITRRAVFVGGGALLLGCLAAWLVGVSLARRLGRVKAHAVRVAAGDLSETRATDTAPDEIGDLARAVQEMVQVVERKVTERTADLEASRERFRALVEGTRTVPWQLDVATQEITYIGPRVAEVLGGAPADWLVRRHWDRHMSVEDMAHVDAALGEVARTGADAEYEFRVRRDDGRMVSLRSVASLTDHDGRPTVFGFMLDITRQRELEAELQQAQKLESVGRLAAGVAHEINTPVQFVSDSVSFAQTAFADLAPLVARYREVLCEKLGQGSPECLELRALEEQADLEYSLEQIPQALVRSVEGLDRVARIVRSMKEFAHPEGRDKTSADLNRALEATLTIATNEYKYVADVETDLAPLPPVTCHVSELNQVFLNIIVNAAHAIAEANAGTDSRGLIRVASHTEGDDVVVSISDTGNGIPEGIRTKIFDPFFTTKGVGRGTGQGLAIARSVVVDKHHGSLTFDTAAGVGTTFHIRVPCMG